MAAVGGRFTFADMQNPLFLHPSDGPLSVSVAKLQGAGDYRSWKRMFEIQLSSKRKLGFLNGTVTRSATDETQAVQWDTCNDLVISWLHANVSDNIKQSILFISTAHEIWKQLETGSRKYKLNKDLFSLSQNKMTVNDYFTKFSGMWEEIDSMNTLPPITATTTEIQTFLKAIVAQKEESKLFVFLNGLYEIYSPLRSQLLMQIHCLLLILHVVSFYKRNLKDLCCKFLMLNFLQCLQKELWTLKLSFVVLVVVKVIHVRNVGQ